MFALNKTRLREETQLAVSLTIPSRPEYLGLCRLVAGVLGASRSLDEESIADLKLVITEACSCFIWGAEGGPGLEGADEAAQAGSLQVDFAIEADGWELRISEPGGRRVLAEAGRCDPRTEQGLRLTVLRALADEVEQIEDEQGGCVLRLAKRLPPVSVPASSPVG